MAVVVDGQVQTLFHTCLFISCVVVLLIQSSVLSLLAIRVDCYLHVHIPLRTVTQGHSWAVVGVSWLAAFILRFVPMFGWYNHQTLAMLDNSTTIVSKEKKLAKSLVLFTTCWLPMCLMNCAAVFGNPADIPQVVVYVGILLSHPNSAMNPIMYVLKVPKICMAYLPVWRRCVLCRWGLVTQSQQGADSNDPSRNVVKTIEDTAD
ncbi:hypothetical protein AAFF_G00409940 [Aldrovandia affinis]|uniref:G-protein coupled receptors family 1 profile domain-containing protein n=1 Tax=Aldrovandia affinis TaxID=143900 RepID=A0AAD7WJX7_9TELE|nr:hypothetical protein AAFF_G00409940 [Aldrovandia affinis]